MNTTIILSTSLILCIIFIMYLIRIIISQKNNNSSLISAKIESESQLKILNQQLVELKDTNNQNTTFSNKLREENSRLQERIHNIENEKERMFKESEIRFKNIANEILERNTTLFKEQNESRLSEILTPLKDNIDQFKKTITERKRLCGT